jgi:hypothetical protein
MTRYRGRHHNDKFLPGLCGCQPANQRIGYQAIGPKNPSPFPDFVESRRLSYFSKSGSSSAQNDGSRNVKQQRRLIGPPGFRRRNSSSPIVAEIAEVAEVSKVTEIIVIVIVIVKSIVVIV